jgi:hypothetical protein
MSGIENTSKRDPLLHLLGAMSEGTSDYIENMERAGGRAMLTATTLPTDGSEKPEVQALGIKWGDPVEGDPIFRHAELPDGWTKTPGDNPHGYWTNICDETGNVRASVFYKAAFYDRRAHIGAERQCRCGHSNSAHPWAGDSGAPDWEHNPTPCTFVGCVGCEDFLGGES